MGRSIETQSPDRFLEPLATDSHGFARINHKDLSVLICTSPWPDRLWVLELVPDAQRDDRIHLEE